MFTRYMTGKSYKMSQTSSIETIESVGPDRFAPAEKFFVSDVEKYVKLRLGSSWPEDDQAASLPSVVKRLVH